MVLKWYTDQLSNKGFRRTYTVSGQHELERMSRHGIRERILGVLYCGGHISLHRYFLDEDGSPLSEGTRSGRNEIGPYSGEFDADGRPRDDNARRISREYGLQRPV